MGREVRRVPPHWEHPKTEVLDYRTQQMVERFQPLYDDTVETRWQEWLVDFQKWKDIECAETQAKYPDEKYTPDYAGYCEWAGPPPDPDYYRPEWRDGEATWYQLYETVSEGTPVSPPFETKEELAQYLAENGDFWYQQDMASPSPFGTFRTKPTIGQARGLVDAGWAMSGMAVISEKGGQMFDPYQQQDIKLNGSDQKNS